MAGKPDDHLGDRVDGRRRVEPDLEYRRTGQPTPHQVGATASGDAVVAGRVRRLVHGPPRPSVRAVAVRTPPRRHRQLQPGVDRLALQGEDAEHALVNPEEGFAGDEALEPLDPEGELADRQRAFVAQAAGPEP